MQRKAREVSAPRASSLNVPASRRVSPHRAKAGRRSRTRNLPLPAAHINSMERLDSDFDARCEKTPRTQ